MRRARYLGELPIDARLQMPGASRVQRPAAASPALGQRTVSPASANFSSAQPFLTRAQSFQILPANLKRFYLLIQDTSAGDIFFNFGAPATVLSFKIAAGGNYEPLVVPINSIWIIGSAAGLAFVVAEG